VLNWRKIPITLIDVALRDSNYRAQLLANRKIVNGVVTVGVGSGGEGQFPEPKLTDVEIVFLELVACERRNCKFPGHRQAGAGRGGALSRESRRGAFPGTT